MSDNNNPFQIKVLMIYDGINDNNVASRAIRGLKQDLEAQEARVVVSESTEDALAIVCSDPTIQCVLLKIDEKKNICCANAGKILASLRERNQDIPVFLMASRTSASEIPTDILDKVNDFIWILEDTTDFITGRIVAATEQYRDYILPPMFRALAAFSNVHEYQ